MGPRANFSCKHCGKVAGTLPVKIEDLPVACTRCPVCGHKRGFVRLFDAIGGIRTSHANDVQRVADAALEPVYKKVGDTKEGARRFEHDANEALEKHYEKATTAERAQLPQGKYQPSMLPAKSVINMIGPQARRDTAEVIYPALTMKRVRPEWHHSKTK